MIEVSSWLTTGAVGFRHRQGRLAAFRPPPLTVFALYCFYSFSFSMLSINAAIKLLLLPEVEECRHDPDRSHGGTGDGQSLAVPPPVLSAGETGPADPSEEGRGEP